MPDQVTPGSTLRDLQNIEVFIRKLQAKAGRGAAVSTYSSACCSACFSSASTVCASGVLAAGAMHPEVAEVFGTLHKLGVSVMGEDGLMEAMIEHAKNNPPINIFEIAKQTP
jgi:hypothetical protein